MKTYSPIGNTMFAQLLLSTVDSQLSISLAQDSLTPPGAPAPTMKSLDQIEPGTPISSAFFTLPSQRLCRPATYKHNMLQF
jgi:hypothetical protein